MGALRRAYSISAANAARRLDQAISFASSFHQRETLVWRQQPRAGRRVRDAPRTRRRRKERHDPQSLFLREGRPARGKAASSNGAGLPRPEKWAGGLQVMIRNHPE